MATFGTVETEYWKSNPGSRENIPAIAAAIRVLTQEEVAEAIVRSIERDQREIVQPGVFKLLSCECPVPENSLPHSGA